MTDLERSIGSVEGRLAALAERLRDDNVQLEHRIASAKHDALEAAKAAAHLDRAIRGEHGHDGLQGRLATLELAHQGLAQDVERVRRSIRGVVAWLVGLVTVVAGGVGLAVVKGWLGLA